MNIGELIIIFSFILTIASAVTYYLLLKGEGREISENTTNSPRLKIARYSFYGATFLVSVASVYLMVLIFTHQFQFAYVYQYSSRDLPPGFLISAFWAGQEGSFLLWAFFMAILGVVFIRTSREFEFHAMFTFAVIQAFFLAILIKASPFFTLAKTPADGAGLNPLLQNFWMVIHPPVLFLGYAAIAVPFSIAIAALAKKDYRNFVSQSIPWTLFSSFALGAGIILGGFWAYVTLGWGGYWGWDPVENSSLIPWITILALLHGLIVQNVTGSLKKSNFFLAIFSFVLVIYATFLTRSGVLEDFSVHSFQNLGINLYLIVFILTMLAIGLVVFFRRYREIPNHPVDFSSLNRENIILMSMLIMVVSTALIFVGTSSPIFTGLAGQSSQVGVSYYNKVNFPIAIIMALLLGFAPFSRWKEDGFTGLLKSIIPSLILTIVTTIIVAVFTSLSLSGIIFLSAALFALWSNTIVFLRYLKANWRLISAPLSHVGVALMLLGIIVSGTLETNEKVLLEQNVPQKVLDYELEYTGISTVSNGKDIVNIKVSGGDWNYLAQPRFYMSEYNQGMMREPDVHSTLFYDIYLSPLERRTAPAPNSQPELLIIKKGETKEIQGLWVQFVGFDMRPHGETDGPMNVGATLLITSNGKKHQVTPTISFGPQGRVNEPVVIPGVKSSTGNDVSVMLGRIDATAGVIELAFLGFGDAGRAAGSESIVLEVSKKPLMNVLWLGTILILVGTLFAFKMRTGVSR